jgi:hypothetical protein
MSLRQMVVQTGVPYGREASRALDQYAGHMAEVPRQESYADLDRMYIVFTCHYQAPLYT